MLTDLKIRRLARDAGLVTEGAVPGLYYKAADIGRGKWVFRFVSPWTGKRRDMGLGPYPEISLADARRSAIGQRELLARGMDPIEARDATERNSQAAAKEPTFAEAARALHGSLKDGFRNTKHSAQWLTTLETFVFPTLGSRPVSELRVSDFADALRPIWLSKPETASRVKQRCAATMDWCVANGLIPASPVSVVDKLLPKQPSKRERVQHQPAVPWKDVPSVYAGFHNAERLPPSAASLCFLILTAARSGEVRGATWQEIDFDTATWTVPAARMKAKAAHRVPLSPQAVQLLCQQAALGLNKTYVFPSRRELPLSDMALTKLLRDRKVASAEPDRVATAHGFRSSFRDWASENGYARDLAERALAHTIKNQAEAAYHRTDLLDQRRGMMADWAAFVASGSDDSAKGDIDAVQEAT